VPFLRRPDGCRIRYQLLGDPGTPRLLILEGAADRIEGWRRSLPTLAGELSVAIVDHRGNGDSDEPPGPCTMATFVEDAIGVFDEIGWDRAHVYGQSFGGMVAQELALTYPHRVRGLVLGCTTAGERHTVPVEEAKVPKGEPWRSWYGPGYPDLHPDEVAEDRRVASGPPEHPEGARRQWEAMVSWDAYDRLPEISAPTLVLHGTEDRIIAPANAEVLAARIPRCELVLLEGAGHVYHWEQPDRADREVLEFLRRDAVA
jgi:3-oxoadipate enol-lactonase